MTELDLGRAILEDRHTPLPGQPGVNTTLAAVRYRVSLEKERTVRSRLRDGSPQLSGMLAVSGLATALGIAWVLSSSGMPYLLLFVPSLELVALKVLVKEEAKPI
jgi:hypothetical protein